MLTFCCTVSNSKSGLSYVLRLRLSVNTKSYVFQYQSSEHHNGYIHFSYASTLVARFMSNRHEQLLSDATVSQHFKMQ